MATRMCHINSSSVEDISRFSGVDDRDARKLIDYRESHGPLKDWSELEEIGGFDKSAVNKLKSECDFD